MGSSRKSGSLMSESARTGKPSIGATKQVGGGGRIAKPPAGGLRRDSKADQQSSNASKLNLAIDTMSQNSKQPSISNSQNGQNQSPENKMSGYGLGFAGKRSNDSKTNSQMNDEGMPTPKNLAARVQPGSGTLPPQK